MLSKGKQITGLMAMAAGLALFAPAAPAEALCPNEAIREAQVSEAFPSGTTSLPRCMALEQVSPSKKFNQPADEISFSIDGTRALFGSTAALGGTDGLRSFGGDWYVASRGESGWSTTATAPPRAFEIANGSDFANPRAFTPELGKWVLFGASQSQNMLGIGQAFIGNLDGSLEPVSPRLEPIDDSGTASIIFNVINTEVRGASADLGRIIFSPNLLSTTYLPGDPVGVGDSNPGSGKNQYVSFVGADGQPTIELLARDRFGTVYGARCGTYVGGGLGGTGTTTTVGQLGQGAIAEDGSWIYFSTRPTQVPGVACSTSNPLRILERVETSDGPEITELIPGGPVEGNDLFQAGSVDGSKVYLTTTRQLAASDSDSGATCSSAPGSSLGCDLYLYDKDKPEGERLTQVSAGEAGSPTPGAGAGVLSSITAVSRDGTHAYFVADGVLTTEANPEGDSAAEGEPNLYLYQRDPAHPAGDLDFVGSLSASDEERLWGSERNSNDAYAVPQRGEGPGGHEVGGDGHVLLFVSAASLTADDLDGGKRDLFRFDSEAGTLERISKPAPGGSEAAPGDVAVGRGGLQNPAEEGRWAAEDGETVTFATPEPLSAQDHDEFEDAYVWTPEEVAMLPSGFEEVAGEQRPTVSTNGVNIGFTTDLRLLSSDGDTARDVYVARIDGGFAQTLEPSPCDSSSGGCQAGDEAVPPPMPAGTRTFSGPGNVKPRVGKPKCKKGFVRKHRRCVKKKRSSQGQGGSK